MNPRELRGTLMPPKGFTTDQDSPTTLVRRRKSSQTQGEEKVKEDKHVCVELTACLGSSGFCCCRARGTVADGFPFVVIIHSVRFFCPWQQSRGTFLRPPRAFKWLVELSLSYDQPNRLHDISCIIQVRVTCCVIVM
ncbi:unnamed protein product [Prorocentrum cordatum]|uniref:Uncharacterized protein n=1 Tax=Prorocentrum cordatum TaxID=2364126 RepID=A0ABN9TL22_9DINO|nr:unnamed protein product [Polarella glacialis]CAK0899235.1 unnamed protein product [Polarella glacialis]